MFTFQIGKTEVTKSLIRSQTLHTGFKLHIAGHSIVKQHRRSPFMPAGGDEEKKKTERVDPCWLSLTYLNSQLPRRQGTGECCLDRRKRQTRSRHGRGSDNVTENKGREGCLANSPSRLHTYLQILRHRLLAEFQSPAAPKRGGAMTYFD